MFKCLYAGRNNSLKCPQFQCAGIVFLFIYTKRMVVKKGGKME